MEKIFTRAPHLHGILSRRTKPSDKKDLRYAPIQCENAAGLGSGGDPYLLPVCSSSQYALSVQFVRSQRKCGARRWYPKLRMPTGPPGCPVNKRVRRREHKAEYKTPPLVKQTTRLQRLTNAICIDGLLHTVDVLTQAPSLSNAL